MNKLEQFLKEDRQWRRDDRIAHARHQLSIAKDKTTQKFWRAVLERNGVCNPGGNDNGEVS